MTHHTTRERSYHRATSCSQTYESSGLEKNVCCTILPKLMLSLFRHYPFRDVTVELVHFLLIRTCVYMEILPAYLLIVVNTLIATLNRSVKDCLTGVMMRAFVTVLL